MEGYSFVIYEEWRQIGCVFEDGSDTRKSERKLRLIPKHSEELYLEDCADEYESQDYSYKFETKKICELDANQIMDIAYQLIGSFELSDTLNYKEKLQMISDKFNHSIDWIKKNKR